MTTQPDSATYRFNTGPALLLAGKPQQAAEPLAVAVELKPDYLEAASLLTTVEIGRGDFERAAALIAVIEEHHPDTALTKANGVVTLPPVIAYFVASDWQLAFRVVPTYWPAKAYWQWEAGAADFWGFLLAGVIFQVAVLVLLARRFNRVMRR